MSVGRTLAKLAPYILNGVDTLPYAHDASTGTTVRNALDWLFAAIYPNAKDSVATYADLPLVGNTLNDYRIVLDDGDGKASGYRWEKREGDVSAKWYKSHDMDWSNDAILASFIDQTLDLYVSKYGRMDLDDAGNPLAGLFAGQAVYGGTDIGSNLTLHANAGDVSDAPADQTGFIQLNDDTRPTSDNTIDLGTTLERFRDMYVAGNLSDGTNFVTIDEAMQAFLHTQDTANPHGTSYDNLTTKLGVLTVDGDASGTVDLSTSGIKTLSLVVANDSHTHDAATTIIGFDSEVYAYLKTALVDTSEVTWIFDDGLETITADITVDTGAIDDVASPVVDTILAGNALGTLWDAVPASVTLTGDVTGTANFSTATGGWSLATEVLFSSLSTLTDVDLTNKTFTASAGTVTASSHGLVTGEKVQLYGSLITGEFVVTVIDANSFTITDTNTDSGYYIPQGAQLLFNTTTGKFNVAKEYEEIRLGELNGLDEDVLDIYVAKNGRTSGQTVHGGISASENLVLDSTVNATKGTIQAKSTITPYDDAVYSGGWTGTDLGSTGRKFNDLHMSGEAKGMRFENVTSLPISSGTKIGRPVFFEGQLYVDNGTEYVLTGGGGSGTGVGDLDTIYSESFDSLDDFTTFFAPTNVSLDEVTPVHGLKSVKFDLSNNSALEKQLPIDPRFRGKKVIISGFYKTDAVASGGAYFGVNDITNLTQIFFGAPITKSTEGVVFSKSFIIPLTCEILSWRVSAGIEAAKTGHLDDVVIRLFEEHDKLESDQGLGNNNPKIRYNSTESEWEASNNGTDYFPFVTPKVKTIDAPYTALTTDDIILIDNTFYGFTLTVTLPPVATAKKIIRIKNIGTGPDAVMVKADGAELIDDANEFNFYRQYDIITIAPCGTFWSVL